MRPSTPRGGQPIGTKSPIVSSVFQYKSLPGSQIISWIPSPWIAGVSHWSTLSILCKRVYKNLILISENKHKSTTLTPQAGPRPDRQQHINHTCASWACTLIRTAVRHAITSTNPKPHSYDIMPKKEKVKRKRKKPFTALLLTPQWASRSPSKTYIRTSPVRELKNLPRLFFDMFA